jgi:G3E family GTPase
MSTMPFSADQTSRIPLTLVVGPSGAGKSSLIRHLIRETTDRCLAIVVDDDRVIDSSMIVKRDGGWFALRNGCVCFIAEDDAAATLASLARQSPRPTQVIVDVDGWSDPRRLAGYGYMPGYSFGGTVAVLDSTDVRRTYDDAAGLTQLEHQVSSAGIILLNKIDLAGDEAAEHARRLLQRLSSSARIVCTEHARIAPPLLVGVGDKPGDLDDWVMFFPWSSDYWPGGTRDGQSAGLGGGARVERHRAWCLTSDEPIPARDFRSWVHQMPASILHARGTIHVREEPQHRQEFHLFGSQWRLERGAPWGRDARSTRILLAGLGTTRRSRPRLETPATRTSLAGRSSKDRRLPT